MMSAFITINGLDFGVFMRGLLVVAVGVVVLMGSVFLLLATNTGFRTGMFLALTGLFGWMFSMGAIWWIYGIGYQGRLPSWKIVEMNRGDLTAAQLVEAKDLGNELVDLAEGGGSEAKALVDLFDAAEKAEEARKPGDPSNAPEVAGWVGMLASNRSRGEAQASVDAFLLAEEEFAAGSYVPVAAFEIGGKPKRPDVACKPRIINASWGGCPERVWHEIKTTVMFKHPPHYAAVMVQAATPQSLNIRPGEAPPTKVRDESQPLYTVIMIRDLGSKRVPPANVTIGSGIIFFALAWRLHRRDKDEAAARAAASAR